MPTEKLVGDIRKLDYLATLYQGDYQSTHPLQEKVEAIVATLTEQEQECFLLRYGERMSIRKISYELYGYLNIKGVQDLLVSIKRKVREGLDGY